ncbi:MAG: DUF4173 domain-containing protein [bacterium]|nr:DUF4173 domain-containing protein [bacterium]
MTDTQQSSSKLKEFKWLLGASLCLGFIFNYLFHGKETGVSLPVFITLYYAYFQRFGAGKQKKRVIELFLLISIILISLACAVFSNPVLFYLNLLILPFMIITHNLLARYETVHLSSMRFVGRIFVRIAHIFDHISPVFRHLPAMFKTEKEGNPAVKKILLGLLITIPLLSVVLPLLASADDIFKSYIIEIPKFIGQFEVFDLIVSSFIIVNAAVFLAGYMLSFKNEKTEPGTGAAAGNKRKWDSITISTILVVINCIYLFFALIQFKYLFGGNSHIQLNGIVYASYARKGFFELLFITIINITLLLSFFSKAKDDSKIQFNVVRVLLSVLVGVTTVILVSAFYKMYLYEAAYGFTYLRFFTHAFMILLFVLFLLTLYSIWVKRFSLVKGYLVTIILFYTALNYVNVDKRIMNANIDRYRETEKIDIDYLSKLSFDAIPGLVEFTESLNTTVESYTRDLMEEKLRGRKRTMKETNPWQSFNVSRYQAANALERIKIPVERATQDKK